MDSGRRGSIVDLYQCKDRNLASILLVSILHKRRSRHDCLSHQCIQNSRHDVRFAFFWTSSDCHCDHYLLLSAKYLTLALAKRTSDWTTLTSVTCPVLSRMITLSPALRIGRNVPGFSGSSNDR